MSNNDKNNNKVVLLGEKLSGARAEDGGETSDNV